VTFPPDELHFSQLKRMGRSPAHFRAGILHPSASTPAQSFGSLVHVLVLGGEFVLFEGKRAGSPWAAFKGLLAGEAHFVFDEKHTGKAWTQAKEDADGRIIVTSADVEAAELGAAIQSARKAAGKYPAPIVTATERDRAQRVADVVLSDPVAAPLLVGAKEVELRWEVQGQKCAGRLDVMGAKLITDLKSSTNSEPNWFTRQAENMAYHAQMDWYAVGARENGFDPQEVYVIAVETKPPYAVTCMRLPTATLTEGAMIWRSWFERFVVCRDSNSWPAYAQCVVDLDIAGVNELVFGGAEEDDDDDPWE